VRTTVGEYKADEYKADEYKADEYKADETEGGKDNRLHNVLPPPPSS